MVQSHGVTSGFRLVVVKIETTSATWASREIAQMRIGMFKIPSKSGLFFHRADIGPVRSLFLK
jgi:hypothetical protein